MTALAPEHVADLRKSGLSDATIATLKFESIRPKEIPIQKAESAYRLPYFDLAGNVNGFERLKLLPAVTSSDGRGIKYYQKPGTPPHLYLPPLLNWKAVATNPKTVLVITEGEKKSACACQRGLITSAVGGVWCWTSTLDNGDKLVLPTLDEFAWTNRTVLLCPDSDAWHDGKEHTILAGFFALGKDLQSRGADVRFIVLPDLHGVKCGLDDWLLVPGNDVEHSWDKLDRLALDHEHFNSLNSWWQRWREKQVVHEALRRSADEEMGHQELAGLHRVTFPAHHVVFSFHRLTDARGGVQAELTVTVGHVELLGETDIGLKSDSGRAKVSATLKGLVPSVPWKRLLERACTSVLKRHRRGEPTIVLEPASSALVPFILNPIAYRDHQTLVYAPGGSCKSYLALYFTLLACHGLQGAGVGGVKSPVLYLDWELNAETVGGRLKALQAGHPELSHHRPFYRRCEVPLHQEVHTIAAAVAERHVTLVIVDSAAMACGGELSSPDAAIGLQQALRKIGCASLVLAHVAKSVQDGQERSAYGTVFFRELARNVWELERASESNPVRVVLSQTKNNFGPKHDPLGFQLAFAGESVTVGAYNIDEEPEFEPKLPVPARIRNYLEEDGAVRTADEIATATGLKLLTVKSALSRDKGRKWQMIGGAGQATGWAVLRQK